MHRVRWQSPSKYKNQRAEHNGVTYHSKKEANFAAELDLRKKAGDIKGWDRQVKMSIDVNGHHICNYYLDFRIFHNDETVEFVEVKGFLTPEANLKMKLFEALHVSSTVRYTVVR